VTGSPHRQLPLSRLGHLIPPLVDGQALVALVPLTADLVWAAKAAWDIARIAAREGRRVALVDLHLEQPALHELVGLAPCEGIVDAFEYGVSLTKAAHEVTGVFLIPCGSDTASADQVYAHPRWPKLQAGFRSEGALLLVFVSPAGLSRFSTPADGAIVLAPEGVAAGFSLHGDVPVLGVARDRWLPSGHRTSPPPSARETPIAPAAPRRRGLYAVVAALIVAALAVGGWALLAGARESFVAPPSPPLTERTTTPEPPPVPLDTLGWTVQLAAYASLPKALAYADHLAESGVTGGGLVSPVPQKEGGPMWYRVLAGSYATRADAANARAELWRRGVAAQGIGDLLRAPYSYRVTGSVDSLRARGLPAVQWNGEATIGAFESPDQAAYTAAALKRAGVRANLLPRMGKP
jgi:hypothetical protein